MLKNTLILLVIGLSGLGTLGCETSTGNSARAGGAGGALIGAGIGSLSHQRAGEGALLGGAIGAIGGAIVGNEVDRQEREAAYGARYDRGYAPRERYYEADYGYGPRYPRYARRSYEPRHYYEVRTYRSYSPRRRYYESYYECD